VVLLESYPYWFQPQTRDLLTLLHGGAIGRVQALQASFGFPLAKPEGNIRMDAALGGGALLDAGSYPMSLIRLVMGSAPQRVLAHATWTAGGVDLATTATLVYDDGRRAQLSCGMDQAVYRHACIVGSEGVIETDYFNHTSTQASGHAWGYVPSRLRVRRGLANTAPFEEVASATGSGFRFAAEAFATLVRERDFSAAARAAAASLDIALTLDAIARSAKLGQAVDLEPRAA
jgi:predicted dehydrogenase